MATASAGRRLPDAYFELVKRFPLRHIRDEDHLEAAQVLIDRLLEEDLDEGGQEYLDALTDLVAVYEEEHVPIPDASEADVLRELMAANRVTQPKLARAAAISQSTISAVLNGDRALTKAQIIALARYFRVPPAVFLPA